MNLPQAISKTHSHLLSLRNAQGHWEGELSSSALSTATAVVALSLVDEEAHRDLIERGALWLIKNQNQDGGWGDTTISKSNLSTTLLCWSALTKEAGFSNPLQDDARACKTRLLCESWIRERVGSLEPDAICKAVIARYGKDKTFSVPILMTCAIGGRLGSHDEAWRRVLALPFELAAFPRSWFGAIGLPVVSYALPALIAIGHARFYHAPPAWWNPLRWLRAALWPIISPMLKTLQPSTGGYLEATPLTSFVTMALASAGEKNHPCIADAVHFLSASQREDGSWAIDTNLATWVTTLSVKALYGSAGTPARNQDQSNSETANINEADKSVRAPIKQWLLDQQYRVIHPFTNAAPGGWAWTDLPGGVPDADDTCGALIALWHLCESDDERKKILSAVEAGITWLLDLQNRDGGMPTFCKGWGALPFDRSTPEITAHALWAWSLWQKNLSHTLRSRLPVAEACAVSYLQKSQQKDGSWLPLWFGNEHSADENNPVHGTAMVLLALGATQQTKMNLHAAAAFLIQSQDANGGWGGAKNVAPSLEETANCASALIAYEQCCRGVSVSGLSAAIEAGARWIISQIEPDSFSAAPIGLYFARLWYHEKMYPVIWTLNALEMLARRNP